MSVTATEAASRIRDLTADNGFWGTNRNDQMHEARDLLSGLSTTDRNAAIAELSDSDLEALADDINSGGVFGAQGLSQDEQRDLFTSLAQGLDGEQLARVSKAFGDREDVIDLGKAVATHGTAGAKVEYVQAMAGRTTDDPTGQSGTTSITGDADAVAVGEVISSLRGNASAVDASLAALDDDQLEAVAQAGMGESVTVSSSPYGGGSVSAHYDTRVLNGVLDAAATGSDPVQKARAFEVGGEVLDHIQKETGWPVVSVGAGDEMEKVQASLTWVLDSDTTGVIRELNVNDRTGGALSAYMKQTLGQEGGQEKVGELVARLQQGNGLNESPATRMEFDADPRAEHTYYRNAEDLGYLSGAIQAGVKANAEDAKAQAELVTGIFSKVIGLAQVNPAVDAGVGVLTDQVMKGVVDELSDSGDLRGAMYDLTFPTDPTTNRPYSGPARTPFGEAESRVINAN